MEDANLKLFCKELPTGERIKPYNYPGKSFLKNIDKDYLTYIYRDVFIRPGSKASYRTERVYQPGAERKVFSK